MTMTEWIPGLLGFLVASALWLLVGISLVDRAYKRGVKDGAFNEFLPQIHHIMRIYDRKQADQTIKDHHPMGDIQ
jgi:hypothetical protein